MNPFAHALRKLPLKKIFDYETSYFGGIYIAIAFCTM